MSKLDDLMIRIETLRKEMTVTAQDKGFTDAESVSISQELDRLLNEYEKIKGKK